MPLEQQFDPDQTIVLDTLAAATAIFGVSKIDASRAQGFRVAKSRIFIAMSAKTNAEGPILVGVSCNVATVTALKNIIEADPQNRNANIARGKGTYVRILGMIGFNQLAFPGDGEPLQPAMEISYGKNGWSIPEGQKLDYWAFNIGSGSLTTGTVINIAAEHFGVWLND